MIRVATGGQKFIKYWENLHLLFFIIVFFLCVVFEILATFTQSLPVIRVASPGQKVIKSWEC